MRSLRGGARRPGRLPDRRRRAARRRLPGVRPTRGGDLRAHPRQTDGRRSSPAAAPPSTRRAVTPSAGTFDERVRHSRGTRHERLRRPATTGRRRLLLPVGPRRPRGSRGRVHRRRATGARGRRRRCRREGRCPRHRRDPRRPRPARGARVLGPHRGRGLGGPPPWRQF